MVSGNVHTVELKGLHNAQLNSLKLYTYKNGVKGTQDLLSGISTMADGYGLKYTAKLASGTYWVEATTPTRTATAAWRWSSLMIPPLFPYSVPMRSMPATAAGWQAPTTPSTIS